MTLEIQLEDREALALDEKARAIGQDLSAYVEGLLRREAQRPLRSLGEITANIEKRRATPLEMSDDEIGEMLEVAKHQMRAERANKL